MTNETLELIEKLAAQLGQSSETLIGWFALRAYWEWMDVLLFAVTLPLFLYLARYAMDKSIAVKQYDDASLGYAVVAIVSWVFGALCIVSLLLDAHQAIMATASPKAYAFEELLKAIVEATP